MWSGLAVFLGGYATHAEHAQRLASFSGIYTLLALTDDPAGSEVNISFAREWTGSAGDLACTARALVTTPGAER
jgi:hypothetical protein